ncbi:putative LTR retrotransposon, partial [Pseudoloma neurophilia]
MKRQKINLNIPKKKIKIGTGNELEWTIPIKVMSRLTKKAESVISNIEEESVTRIKKRIEQKIDIYLKETDFKKPINGEEFRIELKTNEIPNMKPYNIPIYRQEQLKKELDRMVKEDVLIPIDANFGSPCFTEKKENGDLRILNDYRGLNEITMKIENYFPSVQDAFHKMIRSKIFSKFDLKKGYYQVAIHPDDMHKTAFVTPFGKYAYKRIPLGLVNPPKYFHNVIVRILNDIPNITIFLDDILIFTNTLDEHEKIIDEILKRFKEKNIIINKEKSKICQKEITFLGFTISADKYGPDQSRLEDFTKWEKPKTRRQLLRLLGKVNWYRQYVPNLSIKLEPFNSKLKGNKRKVHVTDEEMKIITDIYHYLRDQASLYYPDLNKIFYIETDASEEGFGGILYQDKGIVSYLS